MYCAFRSPPPPTPRDLFFIGVQRLPIPFKERELKLLVFKITYLFKNVGTFYRHFNRNFPRRGEGDIFCRVNKV